MRRGFESEIFRRVRSKSGMALWIVFLAVTGIFMGGLIVSKISRGVQSQLVYADAAVRAQYIAESGVNTLLARLLSRPYHERWFKDAADSGSEIEFAGGTYDYYIHDTPGKPFHVDIWARGTYKDVKRAQFWRQKFDPGFLLSLTKATITMTAELQESEFPESINLNDHSKKMDELAAKRAAGLKKTEQTTAKIRSQSNISGVIGAVGGNPEGAQKSLVPIPKFPLPVLPVLPKFVVTAANAQKPPETNPETGEEKPKCSSPRYSPTREKCKHCTHPW